MTLVIDMAPETERRLRDKAAREGVEPERYVLRTVEECLGRDDDENAPHPSRFEAELFQCINEGLPAETWQKYHALVAKRRAETLTPEQHRSLIELSDQIEMDYARRLESVLALARLRGNSLEKQMQALGIPQRTGE